MTDYFSIALPEDNIRAISSIGLAHIGDGVYELLVRTYLCAHGKATGKGLHRATVDPGAGPGAGTPGTEDTSLAHGGGAGGFSPGPKRPCPLHSPACQPGRIPAGHCPGGTVWLAVSAGAAGTDQRAICVHDGGVSYGTGRNLPASGGGGGRPAGARA